MKLFYRKVIFVLVLILIISVGIYVYKKTTFQLKAGPRKVYSCLKLYILKEKQFPQNEYGLIEAGLLKKPDQDKDNNIQIKYDIYKDILARSELTLDQRIDTKIYSESWGKVNFDEYLISYGIDISQISVKDDKLYKKIGEEFLFFEGPFDILLKKEYEQLNYEIYLFLQKTSFRNEVHVDE